jgi:integrase
MRDLRGFLTEDEVKRLIDSADNFRDKVFLRLLWVTGCRVSEVVGDRSWYKNRVFEPVRVKDVDFKEGVVYLNLLKRKQPMKRRVPLDRITLRLIAEYILAFGLEPNDALFGFTRQRAFQIIRRAGEKAGILRVGEKRLHPHHLRHSHCVAWIRKNNTLEGLRKLQQRIGHASISTTAHYLQFGEEQRREVQDVFGQW